MFKTLLFLVANKMLPLMLIIAVIVLLILYYVRLPFKYWKNKNVPHPPVSYLFGNLGDVLFLKKSIGQVYQRIYTKYPNLPYIGFYKARTPCLLIRNPELIKEVMVKSFNNFRDNDIYVDEKLDPLFAKNPFASKGQQWKKGRSHSAPSFTPKRVKEMHPLIESVAKNLIEFMNSNVVGKPDGVDIKVLCLKYTTDVVANCTLGLEANSFVDPNSEYIKMIDKVLSPSFTNTIKFVLLLVLPSLANLLKVKVIPDDAAAYYKSVITKTIEYRNKNKVQRGDFLDSMNELQQKLGSDIFTADDITAHAVSVFTDGTETVAIVLAFTLYELALRPDLQDKLKSEIEQTLHRSEGDQVDYDAIQTLEFLDQVINENLRKNSPVPAISRICTEKISLESPLGNGERVTIEPGTPITIPIWSIHFDSQYYTDPMSFDPTRFSSDSIESRAKYTFLPFGEGPRMCLGQKFGIGQVKVALVHIIKNFEIKVNKSTTVPYEVDPHYFMLAAKGSMKLDFYKRC